MRAVLERDFRAEASRPRSFLLRGLLAAAVAAAMLYTLNDQRLQLQDAPDRGRLGTFLHSCLSCG